MKKIIAVVLLLAGIGLIALAAFGFLFSEDQANCHRYRSEAQAKLNEAMAARGTPREAALVREAREDSDLADQVCRQAGQTQQNMTLAGLGGLALIIVSIALLVISRKRTARFEAE